MTAKEREARTKRAKALRAKGWSYQRIADKFCVSKSSAERWLNPKGVKARYARFYAANKAKSNEQSKKWRNANPSYSATYYAANKKRFAKRAAENAKKWRIANPEKDKANKARYYAKTKDRRAKYMQKYYAKHRERMIERAMRFNAANKERCVGYYKKYYATTSREQAATRERARQDKLILCLAPYFGD